MLVNIATATTVPLAWSWLCVALGQPAIAVYLWRPTPDPYTVAALRHYQTLSTDTPTDQTTSSTTAIADHPKEHLRR